MSAIPDDLRRIVLEPMMLVYDPPPAASDRTRRRAILVQYAEVLGGLSPRALDDAWRTVQRTHKAWTWPLPAEFVEAIRVNGDAF